MIDISKFQDIRKNNHLIVLDTNILLELYRQPANISQDIISTLKKVKDKIYIPRQVYDEYMRNYQEICGKEKKKYQRVRKELSESTRKLQEDIDKKTNEYRKHNYTDISRLQNNLCQKITELEGIINNFESEHETEIQLNIDFLKNDSVKQFVDLLEGENKVGDEISFSEKMQILQEGHLRFENLIPPGYMDAEKEGVDKFGDLFVWKSIISIAKEKNANIIFVCNDIKEDWWEKDKDVPVDLRLELFKEFKEKNPSLNVNFLTLDKFFGYIAEELQVGKSKSALQLSAIEDVKIYLKEHEATIKQLIDEKLLNINVDEELEEDYLETDGDGLINWSIEDVVVDKEEKNIIYYVNYNINVLYDVISYERQGHISYVGKLVLAIDGKSKYIIEEYSSQGDLQGVEISLIDSIFVEDDEWQIIQEVYRNEPYRVIIDAVRGLKSYKSTISNLNGDFEGYKNISGAILGLQELAKSVKLLKNMEAMNKMVEPLKESVQVAASLQEVAKAMAPLQKYAQNASTLQDMAKHIEPLTKIAKDIKNN